MARSARQIKLLEIIKNEEIYKQEDLANRLRKEGYKATQATVSRDIKDLGLIKIATDSGYKYIVSENKEDKITNKRFNLFKEAVISIKNAQNLVVVKTLSGSANTAAALLDTMEISSILGSVAGDDTILLAIDTAENAIVVAKQLNELL